MIAASANEYIFAWCQRLVVFGIGALFVLIGHTTIATAQSDAKIPVAKPLLNAKFNETYDRVPDTSLGSQLVGLRIGREVGAFDPHKVVVALPPEHKAGFCVWTITTDGRFFSDNAFRVPADRFSSEWVRLSSITQDYGSILRDYQARDVAVRGYLPSKSGCAWRTAVHLPQLGNRPDNLLTVMLNIGDQDATVELIREGVTLVERRKCEKSDGTTRFAFDTQCMLPLNNQSHGKAKLRIVVTDGFLGEVSEDWLVWLPKTKAAKAGNE